MVLRYRPTPTQFRTNILYIPVDNILSLSKPSVCCLRGEGLLFLGENRMLVENRVVPS